MAQLHRIVMVEDCAEDAEITHYFLEREGLPCEIQRVEDRDAFETAIRSRPPAAILCDLNLPSFSGLEAIDIARRLAPNTPFIVFSGLTDGPHIDAIRLRGATKIVAKDNYSQLVVLLQEALEAADVRAACCGKSTAAHLA